MKKLIVIAIVSLASIFLLISILYGQKEKQVVSAERLKIVAMNKLSNIPLRAKLFDLENWVFKAPGGCCHPPAFNSLLSMVIAYPPSFVGEDNFPDEPGGGLFKDVAAPFMGAYIEAHAGISVGHQSGGLVAELLDTPGDPESSGTARVLGKNQTPVVQSRCFGRGHWVIENNVFGRI